MIAIADKFATKKFPISVMFLIETSPIEDLNRRGTHRHRQPGLDAIFRAGRLKTISGFSGRLGCSLHRLCHAAEIDAVNVHRIRCGRHNILLPSRRDVFLKNIEEHVGMFYVGFAMRGKVRYLRGAEI